MYFLAVFLSGLLIGSTVADSEVTRPKLKGVTVVSPPFTFQDKNGKLTGFVVDLMDLISQKANFDYELNIQPTGHYGVIHSNGTADGMIGEVHSKKADFAIADLTVTDARKDFVQFSEPMITCSLAALIRRDLAGPDFAGLEDIITYNEVQVEAGKPDNQIGFGVVATGATIAKLTNSDDPTAKKIAAWLQAHPTDKLKNRQEGVQRVIKGRFAMVLEATFADYAAAQNCSLISLYDKTATIFQRDQALALPKDSPHAGPINQALKELKQDGTVDRLKAKYWKNDCPSVGGKDLY